MGIDKSNVRFVVHAGMPKSLEHYQQECGRAGRDGLEAECSLFFSGGDYGKWQFILSKGEPEVVGVAMKKLKEMADYCGAGVCRRRAILNYFGEEYAREKCDACDVCLGDMEWLEDPLPEAQKILSCIVRLDQRFGGDYTADVLVGAETPRVAERGHDRLSTYGLLKSFGKRVARDWIEQLVAQGFARKVGEYQTLEVTPLGWRAIKAEKTPRLLRPAEKKRRAARSAPIEASWEGVDAGLFEELRVLRRRLAEEKSLPAFVIFSDAALRDMARLRPTKLESFLQARGVGERKTESYGKLFVHVIREYCELKRIATDLAAESSDLDGAPSRMPPAKARAFEMFRQGATIDEAAAALGRARSTTAQYLIDFIAAEGVVDPAPWAEEATLRRVAQAREEAEDDRLKPIFEALGGEIGYDVIRACVGCLKNRERAAAG
jgi:ATP-dependent DNA helicase RecQ